LILGTATATDLVTASPTITSNASGTFPVGKTTVTWTAKDAAGNSSSCAQTVTLTQILTFPYKGFLGSAKNPPMVNVIGPSDVIALKFNLGGDRGLGVIAAGYPSSSKIACANGPLNKAEDIDTSKRGLYYDTKTSTYRYVWQADKSSKGTCQLFTLKLVDGTEHQLLFKITK
jgi:hypothetical protein